MGWRDRGEGGRDRPTDRKSKIREKRKRKQVVERKKESWTQYKLISTMTYEPWKHCTDSLKKPNNNTAKLYQNNRNNWLTGSRNERPIEVLQTIVFQQDC